MTTRRVQIAIMNVASTWPNADTAHKRRMAVAYAWDKPLRANTDYVTGRTGDGLVDEAWKVEGVTPTNEFFTRNGVTRRRDQWLLARRSVRLADVIGKNQVEHINSRLSRGQYVIKYVEVELETGPTASA